MLPGLNTDVKHEGKIYHVQTEDGGLSNPVVVTLIFDHGAIVATHKTSYAEIAKAEDLKTILKDLMHEQHKQMIKDLKAARLIQGPGSPFTEPASPTTPPVSKISKSLDDMILEYLSAKEEREK